ncbi:MAG: hypothetical protein ACE5GJ_11220 [Gemmatimonadota bacterium]
MSRPLSLRSIFFFWVPLAATWLMIATEGPFLAAVIARLANPEFNLAAHGVAFAFAVLIESPVIMLLSASTALVTDQENFRRLRNFSRGLNLATTLILLLVLIPPVYRFVMVTLVGLPEEVARLTYGALWLYLPWPAAIGYRRFLQGVLVRRGRTRLVAYGTVVRLLSMSTGAIVGGWVLHLQGAWTGALALATGVVGEALAVRIMSADTVREVLATPPDEGETPMSYRRIFSFYLPLALTSLIGLAVHPLLTFFMGRAVRPVASLAVFPVVQALSFIFRSMGLSFQDVAIALMGERRQHLPEVGRFGLLLAFATTAGLAAVAFTPLAHVWFITVSGLTEELTQVALPPTRVIVLLPALSVLLALQRAILVKGRRTRPITAASAIEVSMVAVLFILFGFGFDWVGVTAAFSAFLGGRIASNLYLIPKSVEVGRARV